jgi:hypothetical protein
MEAAAYNTLREVANSYRHAHTARKITMSPNNARKVLALTLGKALESHLHARSRPGPI